MDINIETLKDTFKLGYDDYLPSRAKANHIEDLYHNRQYTPEQLEAIGEVGQNPETFNVIKLFARQLIGYYSQVVNTVKATPVQQQDIEIAALTSDVLSYIDRRNHWNSVGDAIKLDGFISGLFCSYRDVKEQKDYDGNTKRDEFGRKLYHVEKEHIPSHQLVLDPMSTKADYSDARFIHRFKWMPEETVKKLFKNKYKDLDAYYNHLNISESEFTFNHDLQFQGVYKQFNNYLIVHTIIEDNKGKTWSIYWSGDTILEKKEITYKEVKNPYRVVKLQDSSTAEYYGIFEEVYQSQNAINQALLQIQLMVNSNKVLVEDGGVDDLAEFTKAYTRVNAVVPVDVLSKIRVENMSGEIQQQYIIIDKAFNRIQRILGINDSFLGNAFASDSGRKVKLQQNATVMALRYLDTKLSLFYRLDGWDTLNLVKQYYRASQVLRIVDESTGERWAEINKPLIHPATNKPVFEPVLNESGSFEKDEWGNILMEPLNHPETDLEFSDLDIEVTAVSYNDLDEQNQIMTETVLNGPAGQMLMTVNPAGFAKIAAMNVKTMKTIYAKEIAQIFEDTAKMLSPQPEQQETLGSAGGGSSQVGGQPNVQNRTDSLIQGSM